MSEKLTDNVVSRRDVLKTAAAGAGVIMTIPMLASVARADEPAPAPAPPPPPAAPAKPPVWKDAGAPDNYKKNTPVRLDLGVVVVAITRTDDKTLEAVSLHCTHRGCELGYDQQSTNLVCPCHGGTFKLDGTNVSGTRFDPSKPLPKLTVLPTQVKDGQVQVNVAAVS